MGEWMRVPDELYHHGVKGMKWGVRRTPEQLGRKLTRSDKKKISSELDDDYTPGQKSAIKSYRSETRKNNKEIGLYEARRSYISEYKKRKSSSNPNRASKSEIAARNKEYSLTSKVQKKQNEASKKMIKAFEDDLVSTYGQGVTKRGQKYLRKKARRMANQYLSEYSW